MPKLRVAKIKGFTVSSCQVSATISLHAEVCNDIVGRDRMIQALLQSSVTCSTGCQCVNGYYIRLLLPPLTVSVALAQHTSSTSALRLQTSLVGLTSVLLNDVTCWFLAPKLSSADGVFQLLHRPSGTLFRHICARQ